MKLSLQSQRQAETVSKAVQAELNAAHAKRSRCKVLSKGNVVSLEIQADDATAMRGAAGSCLNSIILSKSITEV